MVNTIKQNLEFLLKPRNLTFIASLGLASLPNMSFGNVQERVQKGLAYLAELEKPRLTEEQRAEFFTQASVEFNKALKEDPNDCGALTGIGKVHLHTGDSRSAVSVLEKAAEECHNPDLMEALISAYIVNRDYGSARKHIEETLRKNKRTASAYRQLGFIHGQQGKFKEAIEAYRKALEINPEMHVVLHNIGIMYKELGDVANALKHARKAVKINPDFAPAHYGLGLILKKAGRLDEARKEFEKAVELAPAYAETVKSLK